MTSLASSQANACLELRLAIECLAYQQLDSYLSEIPVDAIRKWTPRDVMAQMPEADLRANKTSMIATGREEEPAQRSKNMNMLGEDRRFAFNRANHSHKAFDNFLASPTLYQMPSSCRR
ncbi:hypothetical protein [Bradyrhizobium genosp. P]|uniref:hypothetical protein n=1 Tax=Bradyrhizobium genosp. P TaxID=83641 RepID=UPI003CF20304